MRVVYQSFVSMVFFTLLLGLAYPFLMLGAGYLVAKNQTTGSMVMENGKPVGSLLIAQAMPAGLFQSRPSANNYNPLATGGTAFAVNNPKEISAVKERIKMLQATYGKKGIPEDMVFASGSGIDPDISLNSARYQADYIATFHHIPVKKVMKLIDTHTDYHFFNPPTVNVLKLNLALQALIQQS